MVIGAFLKYLIQRDVMTITFKRFKSSGRKSHQLACNVKVNGKNSTARHIQAKVVIIGGKLALAIRESDPSSPDYSDGYEYALSGNKFCAELLMRQFNIEHLLFTPITITRKPYSKSWFIADELPVKMQAAINQIKWPIHAEIK